jgi:hypothetical protein
MALRIKLMGLILAAAAVGCSTSESDPPANVVAFNSAVESPGDAILTEFDGTIINSSAGPNNVLVNGQEPFLTALHNGSTAALAPANLFTRQNPSLQLNIGISQENVLVSGDSFATLPAGSANPSVGGGFGAFSGATNVSVIGNRITVTFTDSVGVPGLVYAFGVVFSDVEVADKSGLRFLNENNEEILTLRCPAGPDGAHRFIGAVFSQARIASVQIDMGDNIRFTTAPENPTGGGDDYVVIDDFHYDFSQRPVPNTLSPP